MKKQTRVFAWIASMGIILIGLGVVISTSAKSVFEPTSQYYPPWRVGDWWTIETKQPASWLGPSLNAPFQVRDFKLNVTSMQRFEGQDGFVLDVTDLNTSRPFAQLFYRTRDLSLLGGTYYLNGQPIDWEKADQYVQNVLSFDIPRFPTQNATKIDCPPFGSSRPESCYKVGLTGNSFQLWTNSLPWYLHYEREDGLVANLKDTSWETEAVIHTFSLISEGPVDSTAYSDPAGLSEDDKTAPPRKLQYFASSQSTNAAAKVALIDQGHANYYSIVFSPTNYYNYDMFANLFVQQGYQVRTLNGPLTSQALNGVAIYVVPLAQQQYLNNEITILQSFVQNGGSALIVGDWGPSPWSSAPQALASAFGVTINNNSVSDLQHYISGRDYWVYCLSDTFGTHPIMTGLRRLQIYASATLSAPNGTVLLSTWSNSTPPNAPLAIALMYGSGRVTVTGDSNYFDDGLGFNGYGYSPGDDNMQFGINVINWLAGQDFMPAKIVVEVQANGQTVGTRTEGATFTATGTYPSYMTWVFGGKRFETYIYYSVLSLSPLMIRFDRLVVNSPEYAVQDLGETRTILPGSTDFTYNTVYQGVNYAIHISFQLP